MRIQHQPPAPDLAYEVTAPLRVVTADGTVFWSQSWTLQSVQLPEETFLTSLDVHLVVPFQGVDLQFPITLNPNKEPGSYGLGALTGRQREILALFYEGVLSGRMASGHDMITSLDTPLDLVPMEQSDEEVGQTKPAVVRKTKWLANVLFYAALAIGLFLSVGSFVWDRITTVPLQHARVVAPIVPHLVATPGFVTEVFVEPGQSVVQGQRLIAISQPQQEADVADIRRQVAAVSRQIKDGLAQRQAVMEQIKQAEIQAFAHYKEQLRKRRLADFLGDYDLDQVRVTLRLWQSVVDGSTLSARRLTAQIAELDSQHDVLIEKVRLLRRDLGIAKDLASAGDIYATVSGTIRQVPVFDNQHVSRAHVALTIERDTGRQIHAWLPETKFGTVQVGTRVDVRVMTVEGFKNLNGDVVELTGRRDPLISDAFGLHVVIDLDRAASPETQALLVADAPVEASALRPIGAAMAAER